jgi:hypothetical protein
MIYFVTWNNYLACHPITDGHTDGLSLSAFHREFGNNYLACHPITDGHTDGLIPSAFHREFGNNYLACHPITDGHTDGLSPSVFHREFENNYLACHPITDGQNPSVSCRRFNFTDNINDGCANFKGLRIKCASDLVILSTELPTDHEKYGGSLKILVQNSKFTDGFLTHHRRNKLK